MTQITHDTLLFNVHDLVLLMAASQYLLLTLLLLFTRQRREKSSLLLASILFITALQALNNLFIWSDSLRYMLLAWQPDLLLLGSFSFWVQGPLLYWYVSSVLYREFGFHHRDLLHLLPALCMGAMLLWHYYLLPTAQQIALMEQLQFMWSPLMAWFITGWHVSVIIYGSASLVMLWRYRKQLQQRYANVEHGERNWLTWVVVGFMLIAVWRLLVHLLGPNIASDLSNIMGITSNYITFVFVTSLVFISIRYTHLFGGLTREQSLAEGGHDFKEEQIERIVRLMETDKPYLQADISIETLARRVSLPERTVSRILNQHFGKNFFEFINSYRVEESKRLLADPALADSTMLEILAEAGFTSKSTFNAIFKKQVGQTPSQYRQSIAK
ncbi:MAG TPA: AraC family transcriptional regulator [Cellvibrionaceae bacterium]